METNGSGLVRIRGIAVTQSFVSKTDARLFGQRKGVEIRNATYLNNLKLVEKGTRVRLVSVVRFHSWSP